MCISACVCLWVRLPTEARGARLSGTGVTGGGGGESPDTDAGPLEGQRMPLTTEPALRAQLASLYLPSAATPAALSHRSPPLPTPPHPSFFCSGFPHFRYVSYLCVFFAFLGVNWCVSVPCTCVCTCASLSCAHPPGCLFSSLTFGHLVIG